MLLIDDEKDVHIDDSEDTEKMKEQLMIKALDQQMDRL